MKSVPIELDKIRYLRIGIAAMQTINKLLKKPLEKVDLNNLDEMLTVVTVGLQHEDKDITKEKVVELIDNYTDIETVLEATTDAIMEAYGKNAKAAADAAKKKQLNALMKSLEIEEEMEIMDEGEETETEFDTLT